MAKAKPETAELEHPTQSKERLFIQPQGGPPEVYSNYVDVSWTPQDLRIRFTEIVPYPQDVAAGKDWAVKERAVVTIAWTEAKMLRDILNNAVERFERKNGIITVPQLPD